MGEDGALRGAWKFRSNSQFRLILTLPLSSYLPLPCPIPPPLSLTPSHMSPPPPPPLRDAEVLSLFAAIINKLTALVDNDVPRIFEAVFEVRGGEGERWEGVGGEGGKI